MPTNAQHLDHLILHLSRPAEGGLKNHLITLLNELSQDSIPCGLAASADLNAAINQVCPWLQVWRLDIADRPTPFGDLRSAVALRSIVRAQRPAIVHAHGMRAAWISALARLSTPTVVTLHNLYLPGNAVDTFLSRLALNAADIIVCVSQAIARSVELVGVKSPVQTVPNGIVFPRPKALQDRSGYRNSLSINLDVPVITCIARLMPDKGVDVLLDAWRIVSVYQPQAHLIIAGDGPERVLVQAVASRMSNVHVLGQIADTESLLQASDIVAIPSRREGQSIVCLETMASEAKPALVVSDAGGLPEMIENGVTGLISPSENANTLAACILKLINNPVLRQQLGENAYRIVRDRYSARVMSAAITGVYNEIIRRTS